MQNINVARVLLCSKYTSAYREKREEVHHAVVEGQTLEEVNTSCYHRDNPDCETGIKGSTYCILKNSWKGMEVYINIQPEEVEGDC